MNTTSHCWPRAIIHVDMNAFFASIEQLDFPELKGQPIGITNGTTGSCIITCSYEARLYGIKTGMRVKEAKKLCAHFLPCPSRPGRYTEVSRNIMAALQTITPDLEIFSVDEAFLDITRCQKLHGHPIEIAKLVKQVVYQVSGGLLCSVGLSGDKTTAKYAAKQQKPAGFTIIEPWLAKERLKTVPITDLCGVAQGIGNFLAKYGAITCGDVAKLPVSLLAKRFGNLGRRIWYMCQGQDPEPVKPTIAAPKSMGHGKVLPPNTRDIKTLLVYLLHMSEKLAARLRKNHLAAQTFFIGVRSYEHGWIGNKYKLVTSTQDGQDIFKLAKLLLEESWAGQGIYQVQISALDPQVPGLQLDLFSEPPTHQRLNQVMDEINAVYGQFTLAPARLLAKTQAPDVIAPAWKPEGHRRSV
jgi:DNA polymerase-4